MATDSQSIYMCNWCTHTTGFHKSIDCKKTQSIVQQQTGLSLELAKSNLTGYSLLLSPELIWCLKAYLFKLNSLFCSTPLPLHEFLHSALSVCGNIPLQLARNTGHVSPPKVTRGEQPGPLFHMNRAWLGYFGPITGVSLRISASGPYLL